MTDYLKKNEYEHLAKDLEPGEQSNFEHEDCPAGYDRKKRLYIKRTDDDRILAYCHHCGLSGSHSENVYRTSRSKKTTSASGEGRSNTDPRLPYDYDQDTATWHSKARSWIYRYGIKDSEISTYGIGYSQAKRRVVLPIYRDSTLIGTQLRKIFDDDQYNSKYLTNKGNLPLFWYSGHKHDTVVLVEDILSGIKCSRYCDAVALLTANQKDDVIQFLVSKRYSKYLIFLDNDNRQVKEMQVILKNRLSLFGQVKILHANKDPKEHSNSELEELLC